jgi:phosphonoacetaldehyde hydrolase
MSSTQRNSIAAVVFDWAGTTVDHGSLAPVRTLQRLFADRGVAISEEVARRDMGLAKRDHIRCLLRETVVMEAWQARYHRSATESDVEALYQDFIPLQMSCLLDYATVIDGVIPAVAELRSRGIRVGGTTGYTRTMLDTLETTARAQGYVTDRSLCPEDVGVGRPHPAMCHRLAADLQVASLSACVKVGDTLSDIAEGRNAGMWTIGVLRTGNMIGLTKQDWAQLPEQKKEELLHTAASAMREHHAHYVVEAVADILPVLDVIEEKLGKGVRPC